MASLTDELGFTTYLNYDAHGNLASVQKPQDPRPTQIIYDQNFDVPVQVVPLTGAYSAYQVDPNNGDILKVTRVGANSNLSLSLTYDAFGNRLSVNNGLRSYSDGGDSNGLKTSIFDSRNPQSIVYDQKGRIQNRTFQSGRVLKYAYDNHDRVTRIDDSAGPSIVFAYDVMGRLLSRSKTDGETTEKLSFEWDERDRLIAMTDALGNKTVRRYDFVNSNGQKVITDNPTSIADPMGNVTRFSYDNRNRLISKIDANGAVTRYQYNLRGDRVSLTDALGKATVFSYDANRRLIEEKRPTAVRTEHGKTISQLQSIQYQYDLLGRLVLQQTKSVNGTEGVIAIKYAYDDFDRLIGKTLYQIDEKGNTHLQDESLFTYSPQLDAVRMTSANNKHVELTFTNDTAPPFGINNYGVQATNHRNPLGLIEGVFTVRRDVTDHVSEIDDLVSGKRIVSKSYDPAGRLLAIASGDVVRDGLSIRMEYDLFGRKIKQSSTDGLVGTFSYDLQDRPINIQWNHRSPLFGPDLSESLAYDPSGNVMSEQREFGKLKYGYDPVRELTQVAFAPSSRGVSSLRFDDHHDGLIADRAMSYDLVGNRINDTQLGSAEFVENQIVQDRVAQYATDSDGYGRIVAEKSNRGRELKEYVYRADGKLVAFSNADGDWDGKDGKSVRYYYDALGRRIAKKFVIGDGRRERSFTQAYGYYLNEDKILLSKDGKGKTWLYLDGQGIDEHLGEVGPRGALSYATDHLGSVLNGVAAGNRRIFGPFGETKDVSTKEHCQRGSGPVLYGFTGRQFDPESGKYYFRARMYDPVTGRFMSKDPIGLRGGINFYSYAKNDPLIFVDPTGELCAQNAAGYSIVLFGGLIAVFGVASTPAIGIGGIGIVIIGGGLIYYGNQLILEGNQIEAAQNGSTTPDINPSPPTTPESGDGGSLFQGPEDTSDPNSVYYNPLDGTPNVDGAPTGDFSGDVSSV